jgi:hypothetical protein
MKKTHQIGLMTALLAGVAFTTPTQDTVQSASLGTSSGAAFRLNVIPTPGLPIGNFSHAYYWTFDAYNWIFDGSAQAGDPGSDLKTLGVEIAFSFGM